MQKFLPLLALITALLASSCVYESRAPRYSTISRPVSIWEQPSSSFQSGFYDPSSGMNRLTHTGIYPSPQGGYRLYNGVTGIPDTTRLYSPATYSRRDDRSSTPAVESSPTQTDSRRLTGPHSRSLSPRSEVYAGSRSALPEVHEPWRRKAPTVQTQSPADRLASAKSAPKQPAAEAPERAPQSNRDSAGTPAPSEPAKLPFAHPVPGRSGYVKLSDHPNLPEIDVRGIAPGTPVEVPSPAGSGETIQFRVP